MYVTRFNGSIWSGYNHIAGGLTGEIAAPAFTFGDRVTVFIRGDDTPESLHSKTINYDGSDGGARALGFVARSNPVATTPRFGVPDSSDVYALGHNKVLYVYTTDGNRNRLYQRLGGAFDIGGR